MTKSILLNNLRPFYPPEEWADLERLNKAQLSFLWWLESKNKNDQTRT